MYILQSHPAWVCGLKLFEQVQGTVPYGVTPCVGVWIETTLWVSTDPCIFVTPCVGVWIETGALMPNWAAIWSHPAWVCGLKHLIGCR